MRIEVYEGYAIERSRRVNQLLFTCTRTCHRDRARNVISLGPRVVGKERDPRGGGGMQRENKGKSWSSRQTPPNVSRSSFGRRSTLTFWLRGGGWESSRDLAAEAAIR